jgi:hypothetical protein
LNRPAPAALALGLLALAAGCAAPSLLGEGGDGGIARSDAGTDAGPDDGCPAWTVRCGGACVDPFTSGAHCGACDRPCAEGTGCVDGNCLPSVPTTPAPARCATGGAPIRVGEGSDGACLGDLAASAFSRAACACGDVRVAPSGALRVDGFDSRTGAPDANASTLGANGTVDARGPLDIRGDLRVGEALDAAARTTVGRDLEAAALDATAPVDVGRDAFLASLPRGPGAVNVAATLHVPARCDALPASVRAGACVEERIERDDPCGCEPFAIEDTVDARSDPLRNDDLAAGLSPDVLAGPGASGRIDLPCGVYHLSRIAAGGPVTIAAHGRVALIVSDSILADAPIAFVPDPGASLDVIVGGTVLARAPLRIGAPERPGATRLWVGGVCAEGGETCDSDAACCTGDCSAGRCVGDDPERWSVDLGPTAAFAAGIAAPSGVLRLRGAQGVGAVLAGGLVADGSASVTHDAALEAVNDACPPVPEP